MKATQIGLGSLRGKPDDLLVLQIAPGGSAREVFNGPGEIMWAHVSWVAKNGQRSTSVLRLGHLMENVIDEQKIPER